MTVNFKPLKHNSRPRQNYYLKLLVRIRILQFLIITTIFFLIVIPIFSFIQLLLTTKLISIPSSNALIAFILPIFSVSFLTALLAVGILNSQLLWFYKTFILLYIVDILYTESNPFLMVLKFALSIFLYELPFITQYYSFFMKNYQSPNFNSSFEIERLQTLFDEHVTYILALCAILISLTWFFIIILENFQLDLGDKSSIIIPIILMLFSVGILYTRPEFSRTLSHRRIKQNEQNKERSNT